MRRVLTDPALAAELRRKGLAARARVLLGTLGGQDARGLSADRRKGVGGRSDAANVALVHDWLTGMRGGEKVLEVALRAAIPTPTSSRCSTGAAVGVADDRAPPHPHLVRAAAAVRRAALPPLPAAVPVRDRAVRSRRLRPGDQREPLRRQGGGRAGTRAAPLLLPLADALRLGSVRRLLRAGAGGAAGEPLGLPAGDGAAGALGRGHGAPRRPLRGHLAHVAGRIRRYYNREATIVYPPVDTAFFHPCRTLRRGAIS